MSKISLSTSSPSLRATSKRNDEKSLQTIVKQTNSDQRISNGGKSRLSSTLLSTVISVSFGTNFGIYNTSVANNLQPVVVRHINETMSAPWLRDTVAPTPTLLWSVVVSAFTAGSAIGTLCSPPIAEY